MEAESTKDERRSSPGDIFQSTETKEGEEVSKEAIRIANSILMAICVLTLFASMDIYERRAAELTEQVKELQDKTDELQDLLDKSNEIITEVIDELRRQPVTVTVQQEERAVSRGEPRGERRIMEVTAYDLSYQSCGKYPDDPLYGITASGRYVEEWNTIAAGPELPFGTKVYIPYFKDAPNEGIFTVHDRGGAIKNGRIDVYMESYKDCMEFGRRQLEVYILSEGV
jgi:3D (Asp-Asp-Asp) domain-containing protein